MSDCARERNVTLGDIKHNRTADNNWRVDTIEGSEQGPHDVSPFYSDRAGVYWKAGLAGLIEDMPGVYKYTERAKFVARACLYCATPGPDQGNIIGCVEWGFSTSIGENGKRETNIRPSGIICPNGPDIVTGNGESIGSNINKAIEKFNSLADEEFQFHSQLEFQERGPFEN